MLVEVWPKWKKQKNNTRLLALLFFYVLNCLVFTSGVTHAQTNISGQVNTYDTIVNVSASTCGSAVKITGSQSYSVGDLLLFYRTQAAFYDISNSTTFGNLTNLNGTGVFDFAFVIGLGPDTIYLDKRLNTSLNQGDQIISIPQYQTANVVGTLTAAPYQNGLGGVVAIKANKLILNAAIDVSGKGFVGGFSMRNMGFNCGQLGKFYSALSDSGAPKGEGLAPILYNQKNGRGQVVGAGGGGNNHNTGGGGGAAAGFGGNGGLEWTGCNGNAVNGGLGGAAYQPSASRLFFGAGGGSGHNNLSNFSSKGGNGAGLVLLLVDTLEVLNGNIIANGLPGEDIPSLNGAEGAGGGGAGGTVALVVKKIAGNLIIETKGGAGGVVNGGGAGPGGGGGGGLLLLPTSNNLDLSNGSYTFNGLGGSAGFAGTPSDLYGSSAGQSGQLLNSFAVNANLNLGRPLFSLGPNRVLCQGDSLPVVAPVKGPFLWNTNSTDSIIWVKTAGIYWLEAGLTECRSRDTVLVNVIAVNNFSLGANTSFCQGESVQLVAPVKGPFNWSTGSSDSIITITQPGSYWLQTGKGLCSLSDTLKITVNPNPNFRLPPDTTICSSENLIVTAPSGYAQYLWQDGVRQPSRTLTEPGRYWLKITSDKGCSTTDTFYLDTMKLNPPAVFKTDDTAICDVTTLEVDLTNFKGTAIWNDGSLKKYRQLVNSGLYIVTVDGPCNAVVDSLYLKSVDCDTCDFAIPNAFRPNGDGLNEYFTVSPLCGLSYYRISIFDRWGKIHYTSNAINEPWDGTHKGELLSAGVYLYRIEYKFEYNLDQNYISGSVTLLR
jgi:gliding motility-associated-like protein